MKKVTPELRQQIENYLAGADDLTALADLYKSVFNGTLNTKCGSCISDARHHLIKLLNPKNTVMGKYKWTSNPKFADAWVNLTPPGSKTVQVNKDNLNDTFAELILNIPKYCHLVEPTGVTPEIEKELLPEPETLEPTKEETAAQPVGFTSTEAVTPSEGNKQKGKNKKHKYK